MNSITVFGSFEKGWNESVREQNYINETLAMLPRGTLPNISLLVTFVLTRTKSRAKSLIAQKASLKKKCLVVSHPLPVHAMFVSFL